MFILDRINRELQSLNRLELLKICEFSAFFDKILRILLDELFPVFYIFTYNVLKLRHRHHWSAVVMAAGRRFSCSPVFQGVLKSRKPESGIGTRIGTGTGAGT